MALTSSLFVWEWPNRAFHTGKLLLESFKIFQLLASLSSELGVNTDHNFCEAISRPLILCKLGREGLAILPENKNGRVIHVKNTVSAFILWHCVHKGLPHISC